MGKFLYYLLWPFIWFYSPLRLRVSVFVTVADESLLVKNWFGPRKWHLPGGGIKFGESSVQAAKREVSEELGLDIKLADITSLTERPIILKNFGLLIRSQMVEIKLKKKPDLETNGEIVDYKWEKSKKVSREYKFS